MSAAPRTAPWDTRSVRLLLTFSVVAAALIMVAWSGSSQQATLKAQYAWLDLAMVALLLGAVGQVGWLMAARRSVLARQRAVLTPILAAASGGSRTAPQAHGAAGSVWVQVPGTRRGHRAHCQLVVGKAVVPLTRADIADRDVLPCEVCS
jgi:hypothetical protein